MSASQVEMERGSFAGHETFPFRYTWLRKAVAATDGDGRVFRRDDAMVVFGVGKNMVRSIRHWGLACGVLEEDPEVRDNRGRVSADAWYWRQALSFSARIRASSSARGGGGPSNHRGRPAGGHSLHVRLQLAGAQPAGSDSANGQLCPGIGFQNGNRILERRITDSADASFLSTSILGDTE